MTNHLLVLDHQLIQTLSASAQKVAQDVDELVKGKTTVSIERTIARLVSIDGVDKINAIPLPNMIVDSLVRKDALQKGGILAGQCHPAHRQRPADPRRDGRLR
jgi:beta-lysine 5,6-aminomutase alpha subunit